MRSYRAAVTAAVCGLVLVAACGSPSGGLHPSGPETVRMGIFTQAFDSTLPADASRATVMLRFREGLVLWDKSQTASRLVTPARDYVTGQALTNLLASIRSYHTHDVVPAGTDRLFMTKVASLSGSRAVISSCDDGSKFRLQNPRTGRVDQALAAQPQQEYIFDTWHMGLLHGQWAITGVSVASLPSQIAEHCQPGLAATGAPRPPAVPVLLRAVAAAARDASSVHVSGSVAYRGQTLHMDLGLTHSGEDSGQISSNGAEVTVLIIRGLAYLRLNAAFLRRQHAPASACRLVCGKYLRTNARTAGLAGITMSGLMGQLSRSIAHPSGGQVSFAGTIVYAGEPAWVLRNGPGTAVVAAHGQPYLLQIADPGQGTLNFTQWNAVHIPAPPPPSQVLNLSQLGALAA